MGKVSCERMLTIQHNEVLMSAMFATNFIYTIQFKTTIYCLTESLNNQNSSSISYQL